MSFAELEPIIRLLREVAPRRRVAQKLPIMTISHDEGYNPALLGQLASWLEASRVPHAHVVLSADVDPTADSDERLLAVTETDVMAVLGVLCEVASKLEQGTGGRYRLRRFHDVEWLMQQAIAPGVTMSIPDRRNELHRRLHRRAWRINARQTPSDPWWLGAVLFVTKSVGLTARHSGRVPVVSGRYRWFLKQPFLAPEMSGDFIDLADRLTVDRRGGEDQGQVLRLMVHAFLEDLRVALGTRWPLHRRRTVNTIVLISGITRSNGGYRLLQAINTVRNQTGKLDPLLLITSSRKVPPGAEEPLLPSVAPSGMDPLGPWSDELPDRWRRQDTTAWYLSIPISLSQPQVIAQQPDRLVTVNPAQRRRRRNLIGLATFLVAALVGGYIWYGNVHSYSVCGDGFTWLNFRAMETAHRFNDECVGITDGSNANLIPHSDLFDAATKRVLDSNNKVGDRHSSQPRRPVITLVFLASLTPTAETAGNDQLPAEAEQLAGLAVAQEQQLAKNQDSDPLVKVLIANAGRQARHGDWVARKIGELAARDPSIVAAVGLNESRASTAAMIGILAEFGIPVVAATLSADSLADQNPLFFQVSPQNRRQAAIMAAYAQHLITDDIHFNGRQLEPRARIYYSADTTDVYSQNLAADLSMTFSGAGFQVESAAFRPTGLNGAGSEPPDPAVRLLAESKDAGREACSFLGGIVLYVGRPQPDFQGFLSGASSQCRDDPPFILASDDVTRYVANDQARQNNRAVPFKYVSFAVAPQLGQNPAPEAIDFYTQLEKLFPGSRNVAALDGHAALTYDAAVTVITAVSYLSPPQHTIRVTSTSLWAVLPSVTNANGSNQRYLGVTGDIDFGGRTGRRAPLDKPLAILEVRSGEPNADEQAYCGSRTNRHTQPWCPFDTP
jgi:ABC-type branched-subunit amino acid transport system substrate-binding protein